MKYYNLFSLMLLFLFTLGVSKQIRTSSNKPIRYEPGVVVIKLKAQIGKLQKADATGTLTLLQSKYGTAFPEKVFTASATKKMKGAEELERIYTATVPSATDIEALAKKIAQEPSVEYAASIT